MGSFVDLVLAGVAGGRHAAGWHRQHGVGCATDGGKPDVVAVPSLGCGGE